MNGQSRMEEQGLRTRMKTRRMLAAWAMVMLLIAAWLPGLCRAEADVKWGGHIRGQATLSRPQEGSVYRRLGPRTYTDGSGEFRAKSQWFFGDRVFFETHYEAWVSSGNSRENRGAVRNLLPPSLAFTAAAGPPTDDRRLFDLSKTVDSSHSSILYHRLDRLTLKYLPIWGAISVGRQALTWGNGMLFHPMDLFNPFAPTEIQRDYKRGDDMAVVQVRAENLGDFQFLYVPRRDKGTGNVTWNESSLAGKLHMRKGGLDIDIMASRHYDDTVLGAGLSGYLGSAAWRTDAVLTFQDDPDEKRAFLGFVANLDRSWVWWGKNVYGLLEFYANTLGEDDYGAALQDPAIADRLMRGELFTLGRLYLAGEANIELHPLVNVAVTAVTNLQDPSIILQPQLTWDVLQDVEILFGARVCGGAPGTEFGGFRIPGTDLVQGPSDSLFTWATWHF